MARKYTKRAPAYHLHDAPVQKGPQKVEFPHDEPDRSAQIIAHHRSLGASPVSAADIAAMRFEHFKPAVYHIGEDYFCAPDEGETPPEDPRFAWQVIATHFGRNIHRARG
jgi:hypothetical protein